MTDLSILIPARHEMFLKQTIENILLNIQGDTEIIIVLDGEWADPPIVDNERVHLIYHSQSIGQRAATNEAARLSRAKYIMKVDAHCAFDLGFDVKIIQNVEHNWTVIPRMYNLHAFDWKCTECGGQTYQGPKPTKCETCGQADFEMVLIWMPRMSRRTDYARFDKDLHFQYFRHYEKTHKTQEGIDDVMCCVGAAWMMERERYWELGGLDESHGSWGQMGVEIACKSWLSGGRQVVNKNTWFAHLFRTQPGFTFPYPMSFEAQERARKYSQWLWNLEDPTSLPHWDKAIYPLQYIVDKFSPVPDWSEENDSTRSTETPAIY